MSFIVSTHSYLRHVFTESNIFFILLLISSFHTISSAAETPFFSTFPQIALSNQLPGTLSADEAFPLSALIELPNKAVLMWEIKEGYYLYKKSLKVLDANGQIISNTQIPTGQIVTDEFYGEVEVFYEKLLVKIPFKADSQQEGGISLQLSYQGCATAGYCYPIQHKQLNLDIP